MIRKNPYFCIKLNINLKNQKMKKVTLFAVAAMAVLSLASCKKNHTCTCVDNSGGSTTTTVTTAKSSKKGGAAWCTASNAPTSVTVGGTAYPYTSTATCTFA